MGTSNNKDKYGFLFKDVKEYNKYLLTLVCCSILVLTGIISYMVTNSYAKWSSSYVSDNTLKLTATRKKLTEVVKSRVGKDGVVSINQAKTGQITYDSVDYRYSGSNDSVNNYIDFNDETWRIIGVFTVDNGNGGTEERVKIIREKPLNVLKAYGYNYGRWYYNSSSYLSDSYSYYYLNNTYYNTINSKYRKLMADTNYYLGITSSYSSINASTAYTAERASKSTSYNPQYQSAKVGLMYASDYGYAADSSCHSTAIYSYNSSCYSKNWLYNSVYNRAAYTYTGSSTSSYELLMTGYSGNYANTLNVTTGSNYRNSYSSSYLVRPTVYLKASTTLESGNGTKDNHYKINTNFKDADWFISNVAGKDGLEVVTHEIDNTLQVDSKFATEYRYRGGDSVVKNYVTFNNETWRIIGVIPTEDTSGNVENRIKIIKDESIGDKLWNKTQDTATSSWNNWVTGTLNTYLNNDYYNTLSSDAKNMIGTTKYYLGGYSGNPNITTDVMWQYERKNEANRTGYYYGTNPIMQNDADKKIAIMYASDYGYAASKKCTSNLYDYLRSSNCIKTNNWLDKSQDEWLLPQHLDSSNGAFCMYSSGYVHYHSLNYFSKAVRPVLYLSSNVKISGGNGTSEQPYQLTQ